MIEKTLGVARKYGSKALAVGSALTVAGGSAMAAAAPTVDASAGVTFIDSLLAPVGALGASFLIVSIAIKGWKIIRGV